MIKKIAVVTGANYGDEGKGYTIQQFCNKFTKQGLNPIVICHNGGSQKGHTCIKDGIRHVFGHFGSGSLVGCPTYLSEDFIINPIIFRQEYNQLATKGVDLDGMVYVNSKCRITTPFDMFLNDMKERKRDKDRHGSCGLGIFETVDRNKLFMFTILDCQDSYMNQKLDIIKGYFDNEVIKHNLHNYLKNYMSGTLLSSVMNNYLMDLAWMFQHVKIVYEEKEFLESYDSLVFEGSQGLLLDQNNKSGFPHLTPSNTGADNPVKIMEQLDLSNIDIIEACYVTRTYLTRHGAGYLENECKKEDINKYMFDKTNVPNDYQGTLRYGYIDIYSLTNRIFNDFNKYSSNNLPDVCLSMMVTHRNEYDLPKGKYHSIKKLLKEKGLEMEKIYLSYDEESQIIL